ncbi:MAG: lytic transglycosylase domain-containing protein [Firmicutes bacterium]|jgi:soluble lytic murein transglycosylase-like protein|uniref:Lytic transglycosylase domain-containing protein n=1 Tax=Sulfobacillus benefaciens TaxID=453960 RepID=A0A2T2X6K6_9FIRM|nr:lytic transglycosylase domain-containing protein [Bacillota bacterium]MCL5015707.1 lytic transglycosylase domain-containing protein [Bacillota bacterium]PSR30130.1 MAG: lytic transglycosylase domain-containing protein [Sulfobacillus benefaciens]
MEPLLFWALETLFVNDFAPQSNSSSPFQNLVTNQIAGTGNAPASSVPTTSTVGASIEKSIQLAARNTGLSPALLKAVATVESSMNPAAISSAGAIGVMQLMPGTAQNLHVDPYNAGQNILGGAEYLKSLLDTFQGDLPLALAAYNAGPGAVQHFGGIPPYRQTQNYVQKVMSTYQALSPSSPPVL